MAAPCSKPVPPACAPAVTDPRVEESFARRFTAATADALLPIPAQTPNTDEATYGDKCGTYSKAVLQASPGKVDLPAFAKFRTAINSGAFADFEAVPTGGSRTLNGPMGSYAWNFVGADSSQFSVPAAPELTSPQYAAELIELYWCSLLRDVAFRDYSASGASPSHALIKAATHELTNLPAYAGPRAGGKVTAATLFRGGLPGEGTGPYVSQFLITPTNLGAQPISQRYITYQAGLDYMTDPTLWAAVQNGIDTGFHNIPDPHPRYLHNGRGLAAFTHVDELFQAYFTAYLVLRSLNVPVNAGNPYTVSAVQNGFGTFGPPDFASVLAQVAKIALNAVWYQKWVVNLRHRPESGGGLVHFTNHPPPGSTPFAAVPHNDVFSSKALAHSHAKYGTDLLSQPFPEGSPAHPAYPTGHGTVGGACITVLKFFFKGDYILTDPKIPTSDGHGLDDWDVTHTSDAGEAGPLTVNGELHKLAHNITFGHGIHGGIHWRSDSDSSIQLGEAVALAFLHDLACTYPEPFTAHLTKLDGTPATITNQ